MINVTQYKDVLIKICCLLNPFLEHWTYNPVYLNNSSYNRQFPIQSSITEQQQLQLSISHTIQYI
jgi:hypothetical protein